MSRHWLKSSLLSVLLLSTSALAANTAELKVGTGIEKYEITGASDTFTVPPGTRIYASTRVTGIQAAGSVNRISTTPPADSAMLQPSPVLLLGVGDRCAWPRRT